MSDRFLGYKNKDEFNAKVSEEYPGAVDQVAIDPAQSPRAFEYDNPDTDSPLVYLQDGWEGISTPAVYFKDSDWRMKPVGSTLEIQFLSGGSWITDTTFTK